MGRLPVVEMIVLDANILIRAVLGRQVRQLLETYAGHGIRFYAPEIAYAEAAKYLPPLLRKKGKSDADLPATLAYLQSLVQPILQDSYGLFEEEARQRLRGRDEEDWPVLAAALALSCATLGAASGSSVCSPRATRRWLPPCTRAARTTSCGDRRSPTASPARSRTAR